MKDKAFKAYCDKEGTNTIYCHVNTVLNFLAELVQEKGLSYQTVCGYRSAIAKQYLGVNRVSIGQHTAIKRPRKACFI